MAARYGTIEAAEEYLADTGRGELLADFDPDGRAAALFRASLTLDALYQHRFPGHRASATQVLAWPRIVKNWWFPLPVGTVPHLVELATYEILARELETPFGLVQDIDPLSIVKSEQVGPISVSYAVDANSASRISLPLVEGILGSLLLPEEQESRFLPVVV